MLSMSKAVKKTKTKYTGIYFNEKNKKYDIKYNYTIYNPDKQKNEYKQKWKYGIPNIKQAKMELANLQNSITATGKKNISLKRAYQLWLARAETQNFSPKSIKNTVSHLNMLCQFIPKETKMGGDITGEIYEKVMNAVRKYGYSDETIRNINATFRKLIHLCYQKGLTSTNILESADNIRIKPKDDYRVIPEEDFLALQLYFKNHKFFRSEVNNYPKYRFMFFLLYYTGIRLGECLACSMMILNSFPISKKVKNQKTKSFLIFHQTAI